MTTTIRDLESKSTSAPRAREILQAQVDAKRAVAASVFQRIHTTMPTDAIARGSAIRFAAAMPALGSPQGEAPILTAQIAGVGYGLHRHALGQVGERAGVPGAYLAELAAGEPWQRHLAAHTLDECFQNGDAGGKRHLVRSVNGEIRGVLSDKFRRLDSRPLLDAFGEECAKVGAVPVDAHATDVRVGMKAVLPYVMEPVPGEALALGIEWSNSDFGAGKHAVRAFILRLWCLNGATMEDVLSHVHLGGKLSDDLELSQRTYALDTRTTVSALRDVVAAQLAPARVQNLLGTIRQAHEQRVEWRGVAGSLAKRLNKKELAAAKEAFDSDDVVNLPPEKTLWRASNALSWIAGRAESEDRKLELQRLAGEIIDGRRDVA